MDIGAKMNRFEKELCS